MTGLQEKVKALQLECKTSEETKTALVVKNAQLTRRCQLLLAEAEKRASKSEAADDTICARLCLFLHIREQQLIYLREQREKQERTNVGKFERLEAKCAQLEAQIANWSMLAYRVGLLVFVFLFLAFAIWLPQSALVVYIDRNHFRSFSCLLAALLFHILLLETFCKIINRINQTKQNNEQLFMISSHVRFNVLLLL